MSPHPTLSREGRGKEEKDDLRLEFQRLVEDTRGLLLHLEAAGATTVPGGTRTSSRSQKAQVLESLRKKAQDCRACRLAKGRTQAVFGEGDPDAQILFVGEGPGREEDLQGRPFVGAAGALLDRLIHAMHRKRQDLYIANVVKCRPPGNRPPEPDEAAACRPYLETQLLTIRPRVICALGRTAASALLCAEARGGASASAGRETEAPMAALRGRTFEWRGIPLVATFHPAYLLRNPSAKKLVWEDMKRVMSI